MMKAAKVPPVGVMRAPPPPRRKSNATPTRRIRVNEAIQPEAVGRSQDERLIEGQGSDTSIEKSYFFGRRSAYKTDNTLMNSDEIDMPDLYGLEQNLTRARSVPAFLSGSNVGYKNAVYVTAAAIFEKLAARKEVGEVLVQYPPVAESVTVPQFTSPQTKRQAYELAYETLKYQELLEEIIADSGYLFSHPAGEDASALIMVMLFDFQNRRWAPRCHIISDVPQREVEEVDANLLDHRVHLAAALARSRVKNQSQTIDFVLPEDVRKQEKCAADLPQYAWINTMKMTIKALLEHLEFLDYVEFVDTDILIPSRGKYYRRDRHCEDVVIFPADQKEGLKALDVVEKGMMVLQDKTSSLAVQSVAALLTGDDDGDLIHAEVASGLTTAHLAVVLYRKAKERKDTQDFMFRASPGKSESDEKPIVPKVFGFGVKSDQHRKELTTLFDQLKISNIELSSERFEKVDPKKDVMQYAKVKIILLAPQCTRTAVANPIEFMLNEGDRENYRLLKELSHGKMHKKAMEAGLAHTETLKSALHFPDVKSVIYITRSIHSHENEQAINNAIKWYRERHDQHTRPFRVCPPTLPVLSTDIKKEAGSKKQLASTQSLKHNFFKMRQNEQMNGCFIAVLVRELDPNDAAAVKDMLRKAALQGLVVPEKKKEATEKRSPTPSVKSFTADQHRHGTAHKKPQKRPSLSKAGVRSHTKVTTPLKSNAQNIPVKKVVPQPTQPQKAVKPMESSDVDKLLSSYQKAQSAKMVGVQRVNTLEIGMDSSFRKSEKKGGTSVESKELEFDKDYPKRKPNK